VVLLDDTFELLVHDLGGDFPVSRFSGGEQDDVAIALRIALSRYIAETHELRESTFLIFDEIFGSQDEERRGNIFRALRALEPYFPQIFLISHVADVQGEFGNTLVVEAVSAAESRIRDMGEGGA
jgi:exonuclease SbcC